jgi:hypothetical protein
MRVVKSCSAGRRRVPATVVRHRRPRVRRGFTLIEAALCAVIVGFGILSAMELFAALSQQTSTANRMTVAMFLAENVQEAMADLPFRDPDAPGLVREEPLLKDWDDVDDFHGWNSRQEPGALPIDSMRLPIAEMPQYGQAVTVEAVNPNRPSVAEVNPDPEAVRITCVITYRQRPTDPASPAVEVHRLSWVRMRE